MFLSHRTVSLPEAEAMLATHAVVHSGYRVHAVFRERVVSEDALLRRGFDRRGAVGRPIATVLLEGGAGVRTPAGERWLRPGDVCVVARKGDIIMRQEGSRYRAVVCEWEPGIWGERPLDALRVSRAPDEALAVLDALSTALRDANDDDDASRAADALSPAWTALRALGVPLAAVPAERLREPMTAPMLKLSRALDALQSNLRGVPMIADLEATLGLSPRHLNRLVRQFNERYGFNAAGWRDTRNRWRLLMGATLMTAPGATAEGVARAVGFASAATFSRALANVGLPPPGEIATVVRALARAPAP